MEWFLRVSQITGCRKRIDFRVLTLNELREAGVPLIVNLKVSENTIDLNANENLEEIAEKDVDDNDFKERFNFIPLRDLYLVLSVPTRNITI